MKWISAGNADGKITIPDTWIFPHYYEALSVLFRVENALRLFVYVVLKDQYGKKWRDLEIISDEQGKTSIGALARKRIEQGKTFGYLGFIIESPLMHLTSGELIGIITHDSYWPFFKKYFPAARQVVTLKLQEIGIIRNALAHFRPLSPNDVEVVKLNANQMLSEVEWTLIDLIQCPHRVPTNTEDDWYKRLQTIGTEHINITPSQSKDKSWIRITLQYQSALISGSPRPGRAWQSFQMTALDTAAILETQETLKDHVLFATEITPSLRLLDNLRPEAVKEMGFTFSRRVLREKHDEIGGALVEVLSQISQETELLREDQLAQGRLLKVASLWATPNKNEASSQKWIFGNSSGFESLRGPAYDLPEYWGKIGAATDFISGTEDYPWMPVKVSEVEIPF